MNSLILRRVGAIGQLIAGVVTCILGDVVTGTGLISGAVATFRG